MDVKIVNFPQTRVAALEHHGHPALEHESIKKLIAWRLENNIKPSPAHRNYGVHFNNPHTVNPIDYRVDLCISVDEPIATNSYGVINKVIPALRCAHLRHYGARENITAAQYLCEEWLATSGEQLGDFPLIFHYVNVGPQVPEAEMITDVYLPLAP